MKEIMWKILKFSGKRFRLQIVTLVVSGASFCLFLFNYTMKYIYGEPFNWRVFWEYFPNFLSGTVATTIFSFFTLNYFHGLLISRKPFRYFILPLLGCVACLEAYNLLVDYFFPLESNRDNPLPLERQLTGNMVLAILYLIFILVIASIFYLMDVRRINQELEAQKLRLEVEKSQADLKFLKSQINPHFLYNTLNSFYARSLPHSKELADGILTLSEMMRYALSETYSADGKVLLRDEVEHLHNFIKMNQFRFRGNLSIQLKVKGTPSGATVIPFVLITLVENIFKHGDLSDPNHPVQVCIDIKDSSLMYYSWNKKKSGPKELCTGIGLDNICKRLQQAYGSDFYLNIKDEQEWYETNLKIKKL